jgi:hypothetical protein
LIGEAGETLTREPVRAAVELGADAATPLERAGEKCGAGAGARVADELVATAVVADDVAHQS